MESGNIQSVRLGSKSRTFVSKEIGLSLGKLPPQALDLEEAVLGALMLEKDALTNVIDILKPDTFYKESHKEIFQTIVDLFNNSEPVDLLTVTNLLRKKGKLDFVGGAFYITELTSKVSSAAHIESHARIIIEKAIKRELIRIASEIHHDAYEDTVDVFSLLDKTEQSLFEVSEINIRKNYANMASIMHEAMKELEIKKLQGDGLTGIPTGFTALDRVTSGWQKSDMVIIAARPGMGKTAFVVSAMRNAAVEFKKPVAIFSLEMSSIQLVNRLISAEAELESEKIKKGNLEEYEWEQLTHKTAKLADAPIFIDDTPALTILELRAKARKLVAQHGVELIIIDYLQLMSGDSSKNGGGAGNREQEIASISRSLKNIAKELNIPIIALSQLSRAVEVRGGDKKPQLSDLRESGSIEQDADMVLFLYRPEYYGITADEEGNSVQGVGEVIIAKHRNGSLDTVRLKFIGKFTKFCDLDNGGHFGGGFPSGGDFEGQFNKETNTITFQSKANNPGTGGDFNPSGGNVPF
ncbi:MAG: replicative DNA helicase [Cyclobacteriaceae bacterium]|nr:replicative DNA helicase [Cyclobacteriaceae bacterium]